MFILLISSGTDLFGVVKHGDRRVINMGELSDKLEDWSAYKLASREQDLKPTLNSVKLE
jgi:hypothetical protein